MQVEKKKKYALYSAIVGRERGNVQSISARIIYILSQTTGVSEITIDLHIHYCTCFISLASSLRFLPENKSLTDDDNATTSLTEKRERRTLKNTYEKIASKQFYSDRRRTFSPFTRVVRAKRTNGKLYNPMIIPPRTSNIVRSNWRRFWFFDVHIR